MVINQSLVAKTFGTYSIQLFDIQARSWITPAPVSRYFCESLFWASQSKQAAKT